MLIFKDITLSTLWNTDKPANSQYAYFTATKVIKPGFTYNLNTDYGSGITGYNKIKTFSGYRSGKNFRWDRLYNYTSV